MFKKGTGKIINNITEKNINKFENMYEKLINKYGEEKLKKMSPIQLMNLILNDNSK